MASREAVGEAESVFWCSLHVCVFTSMPLGRQSSEAADQGQDEACATSTKQSGSKKSRGRSRGALLRSCRSLN